MITEVVGFFQVITHGLDLAAVAASWSPCGFSPSQEMARMTDEFGIDYKILKFRRPFKKLQFSFVEDIKTSNTWGVCGCVATSVASFLPNFTLELNTAFNFKLFSSWVSISFEGQNWCQKLLTVLIGFVRWAPMREYLWQFKFSHFEPSKHSKSPLWFLGRLRWIQGMCRCNLPYSPSAWSMWNLWNLLPLWGYLRCKTQVKMKC